MNNIILQMKKKYTYSILGLLAIAVYFGYNYIYQDHRQISEETADYVVKANILTNEFQDNTSQSQKKYLNKTLVISGSVTEIEEGSITLDNTVFCSLLNANKRSGVLVDTKISIKGRCIGYDDLLEQIKLDQSTIINTTE